MVSCSISYLQKLVAELEVAGLEVAGLEVAGLGFVWWWCHLQEIPITITTLQYKFLTVHTEMNVNVHAIMKEIVHMQRWSNCWKKCNFPLYCIAGNFCLCKISQKCIHRLSRKNFLFLFLRKCVMLWPHLHQLMAMPGMRTKETTLNDEAKKLVQQWPSQLWKVSRLLPWVRNWHVGFSTADLDFDNFGASPTVWHFV